MTNDQHGLLAVPVVAGKTARITRRQMLGAVGASAAVAGSAVAALTWLEQRTPPRKRLCLVAQPGPKSRFELRELDGDLQRMLPFGDDGDAWSICGSFDGGESLLLWSREWAAAAGKTGFSTEWQKSRTRLWRYHVARNRIEEIFPNARRHLEPVIALPDGSGMLVESFEGGVGVIFAFDWNGKMLWPFLGSADAKHYCFSWSPDKTRLVFHIAGPDPDRYWVCTSDDHGRNRRPLCRQYDRLIFGPQWSPDGRQVLAIGTDWKPEKDVESADVYVIDSATRRARILPRLPHWSNARYGPAANPSFGSNLPAWCADGSVLVTLLRPDNGHSAFWTDFHHGLDDHFGSRFRAGSAVGGTQIVRVFADGTRQAVSPYVAGVWATRAAELSDGSILYRVWSQREPELRRTVLRRPDGSERTFDNLAGYALELMV